MSNQLKALAVFTGTVIGVGIFGLPWVGKISGFLILVFYFITLGIVAAIIHWLFGEVTLGTQGVHRLPGYVRLYLGKKWSNFALINTCFGLFGAQLAYLIVGGQFLNSLLSPLIGGNSLLYTIVFFVLGSYLIFRGIKGISLTEFLILGFLISIIILFFVRALPLIKLHSLLTIKPNRLMYPYGVVLFSLWGVAIVPEVKEIVKGNRRLLKKTIILGTIISALVYLVFSLVVIGVSGQTTTQDAFSGLIPFFGSNIVKLGFIFGLFASFSSFLTLGLTLKKIFLYDVRLSRLVSFSLASFVPIILFLLGFNQFISIIGLTGAFVMGIEGTIVVFLYKRFLAVKKATKISYFYYLLPLFFVCGVFAEIFYFFQF